MYMLCSYDFDIVVKLASELVFGKCINGHRSLVDFMHVKRRRMVLM